MGSYTMGSYTMGSYGEISNQTVNLLYSLQKFYTEQQALKWCINVAEALDSMLSMEVRVLHNALHVPHMCAHIHITQTLCRRCHAQTLQPAACPDLASWRPTRQPLVLVMHAASHPAP